MRAIFGYLKRYLPVAEGAAQDVYVPLTTNALQTINGNGYQILGAPPGIVSMPVSINPNARPLNTVSINNQIPGFYVTQGLINNAPGNNF
jgi:hypothetical protein